MISNKVKSELGEEIFSQALGIFMKNANRDFMLLNLYTEAKDYSNAKDICHKLLGSCMSIGVKRIPTLLRKMDNDLKQRYCNINDLSDVNALYDELKIHVLQVYDMQIES